MSSKRVNELLAPVPNILHQLRANIVKRNLDSNIEKEYIDAIQACWWAIDAIHRLDLKQSFQFENFLIEAMSNSIFRFKTLKMNESRAGQAFIDLFEQLQSEATAFPQLAVSSASILHGSVYHIKSILC